MYAMPANSESLSRFGMYLIIASFNCDTNTYVTFQLKLASYENRWVAIGDSAVSFDSLSSQGMLTALYSAKLGSYIFSVL